MNDYFRFYADSAILNRALEFPVNHFRIETRIFAYVLMPNSCKHDVTPSNMAVIRRQKAVINDVMENQTGVRLTSVY